MDGAYSRAMVSALALALWMIASAAFLGGAVGYGVAVGVAAFVTSGWAMRRRDDVEMLWALIFAFVVIVSVIRAISFLLH